MKIHIKVTMPSLSSSPRGPLPGPALHHKHPPTVNHWPSAIALSFCRRSVRPARIWISIGHGVIWSAVASTYLVLVLPRKIGYGALPIGLGDPYSSKYGTRTTKEPQPISTTKIMPIATQAISKKQKEEGRIGQVELELRKPGVIVDGDECAI